MNAIDAMNSLTDPVVFAFDSLVHGCTKIWTAPEIVTAAQRRKFCGQPPTTAGRNSIGDEINWESLLVGCHEDLVVITLDQDYLDHIDLLQREYLRRTSKLLLRVTRRLAPILEEFGDRSPAIEAAEKSIHAIYRYHVTDFGLRLALFFTRFYARILRPGLAIVMPPEVPATSKLRSSFEAFEREVDNWCEAAKLAA